MILPCDSRLPPYNTAATRPERSKIGLPDDPGAPYPSTCTTLERALLTVPTVSVGSATMPDWPRRSIGRSSPSGYLTIATGTPRARAGGYVTHPAARGV